MSVISHKHYNSILFLTVYFGLVLVGAAPQVLAHSATNSLFDLRSEIEYSDDLDNKPDSDEVNDFLAILPEKAVADFIAELKKLEKSGKRISRRRYDINWDYSFEFAGDNKSSALTSAPSVMEKTDSHPQIKLNTSNASHIFNNRFQQIAAKFKTDNEPQFIKSERLGETKIVTLTGDYSFVGKNLEFKFYFSHGSPADSEIFSKNLNLAFVRQARNAKDAVSKLTYNSIRALSFGGCVLVVLNLPRASIDSLLK